MKKLTFQSAFFNTRLLTGSPFVITGVLLAIAALGAGSAFDRNSGVAAGRNSHTTSPGGERALAPTAQLSAEELAVSLADTLPTRSTFVAKWNKVNGATGYRLDVSSDISFASYLEGYRDLDVGDALGTTVTGLKLGTTYYYRIRAYNAGGSWAASNTTAATTVATAGLNIVPTFDASITGNANSVAIQASINRAIAILENLYRDTVTAPIRFRYSTVDADGSPLSGIARSNYGIHAFPWNTYLNSLRSDAKSSNDSVANTYLPTNPPPGITNIVISTANGRAVGLNTPPTMCSNAGFSCAGPFYDGIVSLNAAEPIQFTRPASASKYDAQMALEHEIDEVLGLGTFHDCSYCQNNSALRPADLYSWSAAGSRSNLTTGLRYFSINNGTTRVVDFNQQSNGDRGDWAGTCPHPVPRPQDAFLCFGQSADVAAASAEGIHLDVIGYDLGGGVTARDRYDFNGDGKPDYVIYNASTRRTAIWYLNNNTLISSAYGPVIPAGWRLVDVADFNANGKPDYLLYNLATHQSAIWYLNNSTVASSAYGPMLPTGWEVVLAGDFNADGKPDYVLYNASTLQTAIWYMNNNVFVNTVLGPSLASGYKVVSVADFNRDGKSDYLLFNASTHRSAIGYLNGATLTSNAFGPTITAGYGLVGAADFNRDGKPDYALFNPGARSTAIWNLNNNVFVSSAFGPAIPAGWSLIRP